MNYVVPSSIALAAASAVTLSEAAGVHHDITALAQDTPIAWVRAVHAEGWVFTLKEENYRGGILVKGDPLELDDYSMHRPDGRRDDTEQLIEAMRKHEQWRSVRAAASAEIPIDTRQIRELTVTHLRAWNDWGKAIEECDAREPNISRETRNSIQRRASRAETTALKRLLAYVPSTVEELQIKMTYLRRTPTYEHSDIPRDDWLILVKSILKMTR